MWCGGREEDFDEKERVGRLSRMVLKDDRKVERHFFAFHFPNKV